MAVLVTGIGYLGASLVEELLRRGETVVGLENHFSTDDAALARLVAGGLRLVEGDIADPAAVERAFTLAPLTTVYHFAAQASAAPDAAPPEYTERSNLQGPRVVLDALVRHGVPSLVFASSFKVYGEQLAGVVDEDRPYGAFRDLSHLSKVYVEKLLELYASAHGLRCLALRFGVVYGVGPVVKTDGRFMTAPNKFARQAACGEPLTVHNGGRVEAGFVHLADATRATLAAAEHAGFAGYLPLNVVGEVASIGAVARLVAAAAAARGLAVHGLDNASDPAGTATTAFTVSSRLDGRWPGYSRCLRDGVAEALDYFLAASAVTHGARA